METVVWVFFAILSFIALGKLMSNNYKADLPLCNNLPSATNPKTTNVAIKK